MQETDPGHSSGLMEPFAELLRSLSLLKNSYSADVIKELIMRASGLFNSWQAVRQCWQIISVDILQNLYYWLKQGTCLGLNSSNTFYFTTIFSCLSFAHCFAVHALLLLLKQFWETRFWPPTHHSKPLWLLWYGVGWAPTGFQIILCDRSTVQKAISTSVCFTQIINHIELLLTMLHPPLFCCTFYSVGSCIHVCCVLIIEDTIQQLCNYMPIL